MQKAVLILAKAYPPDVGGVQSYSEFVARAYLKAGLLPIVVSVFAGRRGWHERRYPEGAVRVLNLGPGAQPAVFARMLAAGAWLCLTRRFALLHPTTWRPALALWPWRRGRPVVLTVHGQEVLACPAPLRRAMRGVLSGADLVTTVSHATMVAARGVLEDQAPRGHWQVAFNGLSHLDAARAFQRPLAADDAPLRILSFARLARRKNIHGSLHALALLRDEGLTNFRYLIAGTGPMRDEIAALIDRLGLRDLVSMAGYVAEADIPDLYRNADVFLHPQTAPEAGRDLEGFGLAIADAMSFGAAVIVGKDGGPADFVAAEQRGLVVDGADTAAIATALRRLLTDPALRLRLAAEGRRWSLDALSWDRHVGQILDSLTDRKLI